MTESDTLVKKSYKKSQTTEKKSETSDKKWKKRTNYQEKSQTCIKNSEATLTKTQTCKKTCHKLM